MIPHAPIQHTPHGVLYDLDALCAIHLPGTAPLVAGLSGLELALLVAALWAVIATVVAAVIAIASSRRSQQP